MKLSPPAYIKKGFSGTAKTIKAGRFSLARFIKSGSIN
jgi:hypothetical protein